MADTARALFAPLGWLVLALICFAAPIVTSEVQTTISPGEIQHEIGAAYLAQPHFKVHWPFEVRSDGTSGGESKLSVFENSHSLGPAHAMHATIRESGAGAYSHWNGTLYFSTSDGSDPRTNGRPYAARSRAQLPAFLSAMLMLAGAGALIAFRQSLKHGQGRRIGDTLAKWMPRDHVRGRLRGSAMTAAASAGVALLFACFAVLSYKTNDDVVMRLTAEGLLGDGYHSELLLFQSVLIGNLLRVLYQAMPAVPWYDLEISTSALAGALICLAAVARLCGRRRELIFCGLAGIASLLPIFQSLQFTASATLLGGGAVLAAASIWCRPLSNPRLTYVIAAIVVAAFWCGSLIRFEGAFLALAMLPVIGVWVFRFNRLQVTALGALVAATVLAVATHAYDRSYYNSIAGWEGFWEESNQRARAVDQGFIDLSQADAFQSALNAAGWTANDFELQRGWLFANDQLFNAKRTKLFADLAPRKPILQRAQDAYVQLAQSPNLVVTFVVLCLIPVLMSRTIYAAIVAGSVVSWALFCVLLFGVALKATYFLHVVWPFLAVFALANAGLTFGRSYSSATSFESAERAFTGAIGLGLAAYLVLMSINTARARGIDLIELRQRVDRDLAAWPLHAGDTAIVWDANFPYDRWTQPFRRIQTTAWRFFHTNAAMASPFSKPLFDYWGTKDLALLICTRPDFYMVDAGVGYAPRHAKMLSTYMQEHFGKRVSISRVFQGRALALFQCRES